MSVSGRRRLLFVVNNPSFFLSHRLQIALGALRHGLEVHVATGEAHRADEIERHGMICHSFRFSHAGRRPWQELATFVDFVRLYRRLKPDVVHHVTSKPVLYGTIAARIARVPGVVNAISGLGHVFADPKERITRAFVRVGYGVALRHPHMRVIFQNEEHRALFIREGWVRKDEAVLIPGVGVDLAQFAPSTEPRTGEPVVLLASRMLRTKGIYEYVEAARRLKARHVLARFALAGAPDPRNLGTISAQQLDDWNREGAVEYWGHFDDVSAALLKSDIACLPSYSEGLPKSLAEAAACGLPIVASDIGGCRAVVTEGENGFLVPPMDVDRLEHALEVLINDAELRRRMGKASRQRATNEFAIDKIVASHVTLYRSLLP